MNYLDPKNDFVLRKLFGQHPRLLKSFLNAILPLPEGTLVESFEYLPVVMDLKSLQFIEKLNQLYERYRKDAGNHLEEIG